MRKSIAAALLLFVILSLLLTYPLPLHLADAVEDPQDALLNVWITAWDGHQLLSDPLRLFDANIFYSYPRTLAYSELLLGNGLLALPITAVTGNPVLGYNLALLLSFILSGFGTYLLVLRLTRSHAGGLVAGVIFCFSAYRLTNMAQAQLLTTQWLPLALLALHQLLRRPRIRYLCTFVLFFCLQALSSFYYAILLALAVALFAAWFLLFGQSSPGVRRSKLLLYLLLASILCAVVMLPFALPYFRVQADLGFERTLADNEPFSASLRQYLMVPPGSLLHGRWLPSDDTPIAGGYPVDALFPGFVALVLGLLGLIRGQGRTRWYFFVLALVAFVLSLGPRLYLAPGQAAGLNLPLPYAWLYALVPGFKALRAPARFDVLVMLSLAVLAGYAVASWHSLKTRARRAWLFVTAFLLLVVVLESLVWPAARAHKVPVGGDVPDTYRWLAGQPSAAVLELPMAFTPGGPRLEYQYLSTYHWQTTPDGYSGFIPSNHGQIVFEMERFPSERAVSLLQALGVHHVVLHSDRLPPDRWVAIEAALAQFAVLTSARTFGPDQVLEVAPRAFDTMDLQTGAYFPPRAAAGEPYTAYLIVTNNGSSSYALRPTDSVAPSFSWGISEQSPETASSQDLPLVTSPDGGAAVIPLSVVAPANPGAYTVSMGELEGPFGRWAAGTEVTVGDQSDVDFPVPIRLEDWRVPESVRQGESLVVDLTWRALGKIDAYYSVYVKLLDSEGHAVSGWDGQPRNGQAPTLLWLPGETVEDEITLPLPDGLPPGEYTLEVGMYRAQDLARCLTLDSEGAPKAHIILGTIAIQP